MTNMIDADLRISVNNTSIMREAEVVKGGKFEVWI